MHIDLKGVETMKDLYGKETFLPKGTYVEIERTGRFRLHGYVLTANNYGRESDDWYIELSDRYTGKYHYWKQSSDGGELKIFATQ